MSSDKLLRTSVAADLGSLAAAFAAPTPAAELPAGTVVGHFVLEATLGRGGMGLVYRAHDQELDRRVAIKVGLGGADLARARREAMALARLAHPNVVTIYEIGEHGGVPFVAMELCEGGTVRSWTRAATRSWREILAVYLDAGRGLGAAHAAGLIHRDVKPDNILLGDDRRARMADFGLARGADGPAPAGGAIAASEDAVTVDGRTTAAVDTTPGPPPRSSDGLTMTGAIVGTPRYMAPEQLAGGRLDARTDQFAFCVALYESLTGVDPFPAEPTARSAAMAASRFTPPPRGREVPRQVLAVIERGLAPAPLARFPTMDALLTALTRAARPRWRRTAAAGGVVVVAAVGALVGFALHRDAAVPATVTSCAALPTDLAPGWTAAGRKAFIDGNPGAGETTRWAAEMIDREVRRLAEARAVCEDLLQRSDRPGVMARSGGASCLAHAAAEVAKVIALRGQRSNELSVAVGQIVESSSCAANLASTATLPDRASAVWQQIAQAESLASQGDLTGAVTVATAARRAAQADGVEVVITRAEFTLETILQQQARQLRRGLPPRRPRAAPAPRTGSAPAMTTIPGGDQVDPRAVPSLVADGDTLHVFARSRHGTLLAARRVAGTWRGFEAVMARGTSEPETLVSDPSAVAAGGHVDVFYIKPMVGKLMHAVAAPDGWTVRNEGGLVSRVGTTLATGPVARFTPIAPDPTLYPWFDHRTWITMTSSDDSVPSAFGLLPEHVTAATRPSAALGQGGRIDVVALDNRGHLAWHTRQGDDFGETRWVWRPDGLAANIELEEPVIVASGEQLVIVVRASDGELWIAQATTSDALFGELARLGARSDVAPAVVARGDGRVTVIAREGNAGYALDIEGSGAASRVDFPASLAGAVAATGDARGVDVLAFTPDGQLQHGRHGDLP